MEEWERNAKCSIRLSSLLSEKRNEDTKIRFALLRSALMCVRGTRHRYYKPNLKDVDMDLEMRDSAISAKNKLNPFIFYSFL